MPASAGMTKREAGMTEKRSNNDKVGMMEERSGTAEKETERTIKNPVAPVETGAQLFSVS